MAKSQGVSRSPSRGPKVGGRGFMLGNKVESIRMVTNGMELQRYFQDFNAFNCAMRVYPEDQGDVMMVASNASELAQLLKRRLEQPLQESQAYVLHYFTPEERSKIAEDEAFMRARRDILKLRGEVLGLKTAALVNDAQLPSPN